MDNPDTKQLQPANCPYEEKSSQPKTTAPTKLKLQLDTDTQPICSGDACNDESLNQCPPYLHKPEPTDVCGHSHLRHRPIPIITTPNFVSTGKSIPTLSQSFAQQPLPSFQQPPPRVVAKDSASLEIENQQEGGEVEGGES